MLECLHYLLATYDDAGATYHDAITSFIQDLIKEGLADNLWTCYSKLNETSAKGHPDVFKQKKNKALWNIKNTELWKANLLDLELSLLIITFKLYSLMDNMTMERL